MARKSSRSSTRTPSDENTTDLASAQLAQTRHQLSKLPPRPIIEGRVVGRCVTCESEIVETGNLERHFILPGREVVVTGLSGEKCLACGEEWLDAPSVGRLVPYQKMRILASYGGKISQVGGQSLGTYIPQDVARSMGLVKGTPTHIYILDENHFLVKVER
jgi:YgiT-type zinc finger domain-containing protein